MTVGEMDKLTKRFNSILSGWPGLRTQRLENLLFDLEEAYGVPGYQNESFAKESPVLSQLYDTVFEEFSDSVEVVG
ncbi:hypothetical protein DCC39_14395 [Pueribacillus theae]|uniref:Uncharacterized protein n=1 Tax=Pueribacillus theae TaxID=2171751 RepID=A0A2U1JTU1_9BACI|nr:hypothetical protein [Pueribacillus theae]PWA08626.1 hypothetical protein DCC39_14395 [Pueribacillus theae]